MTRGQTYLYCLVGGSPSLHGQQYLIVKLLALHSSGLAEEEHPRKRSDSLSVLAQFWRRYVRVPPEENDE